MAELVVRVIPRNGYMTSYEWQKVSLPLRPTTPAYTPPVGFVASKASLEELCTYRMAVGLQEAKKLVACFEFDECEAMVKRADRVRSEQIDELIVGLLRGLDIPSTKKVCLLPYDPLNWS